MSLNPLKLFRPPSPEDAAKSGVKLNAPSLPSDVGEAVGGIWHSIRHATAGLLSIPTRLVGGTLSLASNVLRMPEKLISNPVNRLMDYWHARMHKVVAGT